jgi:lipopolysaccharide transport system ATP-binding protein
MHALEARNVSKTYRLYGKPFDRLKEALLRRPYHQPFEGLRDISFAVSFGESLGIVGENGAGKSTLLKILAGTVTPTSGEVIRRGRIAALLELGSGFHPEFSGRQNIHLNASLLGLAGTEIDEREPAIVDFAELGQFIDRPLKTYSSGMVVRLAFSIAACVDPDVLIIDEALSVGDQYFQRKCVDRMTAFQEQGKTILFCSHALVMVNTLCRRALWLDRGGLREEGPATRVTAAYESYVREKTMVRLEHAEPGLPRGGQSMPVVIRSITLNGRSGPLTLGYGDGLTVLLEYESFDDRPFWVALGIRRNDELICHAVSMARDLARPLRGKGNGKVLLRYPRLPFFHGVFFVVGIVLDESELVYYGKKESSPFSILPPERWRSEVGLLDLAHEWEIP